MKVNYLVVFYMGPRRWGWLDGPEALKAHLDWFVNNKTEVEKITVILNMDQPVDLKITRAVVSQYKDKLNVHIYPRVNTGFSYGGWNDAIMKSIDMGEDFTHYFLTEDDYMPGRPDFLDVYKSQMHDTIAFVASRLSPLENPGAMISTGLLSAEAAKDIYKKEGRVFRTISGANYATGELNQGFFTQFMRPNGWELADIRYLASIPFFERATGEPIIVEYGDPEKEPILIPLLPPLDRPIGYRKGTI